MNINEVASQIAASVSMYVVDRWASIAPDKIVADTEFFLKVIGDVKEILENQEAKETQPDDSQDIWGIVEMMGHSKCAGRLSEHTGLGVPLLRIEVPALDGRDAFERLLGKDAIFRITPCTKDAATIAARQFRVRPLELVAPPDSWDQQSLLPPMDRDDWDDDDV